jgi:hypothetical protein
MDTALPADLLAEFYRANALPADGGQSSPFVKIQLTPKIAIYFPNFDSRRRAVLRHDVHHMVTGYSAASLAGESEISAWEIASGCTRYPAAFFINTAGVLSGLPFNFRNGLRAFARGRRTRNLYHDTLTEEVFLHTPVHALKKHLLLDVHLQQTRPGIVDALLYIGFILFGILYSVLIIPLLIFVLGYTFYILISGKDKQTGN